MVVIQINNVQIGYCDSNIKTTLPKQDWMDKLRQEDPQYWGWISRQCLVHQQLFKEEFLDLRRRLNDTQTVHSLQRLTGCEWVEENEEVTGFHRYGYDGESFLEFDLKTQTWITSKPESVDIISKDNEKNFWTDFVNRFCINWLKKLPKYARSSLMTPVRPSVSLLQKTPSSAVSCHATGFYPNRAELFWSKYGVEIHEGVDKGEILPNHDGTFQMSVEMDFSSVPEEERKKYECVFQLSGVKVDIITSLGGSMTNELVIKYLETRIAGVVVGVVVGLLLLCMTALLLWKKNKTGFRAASSKFSPH
ncbi:major histocompatibility complex class I-related gene protein-like [Parambassis ranga]|uniref:Major histocompatibility complex class I-related gene protein-like n=1 Tax=Parambassis ranga TaxID=210632 RepID=A0A6P7JG79_9TELE|nr:major histocompatibility complex class I-related gene protein-like [Parambassis ranga]